MRGIVFRYLFAEVSRTWLVVTGVLLFLTLGLGLSRFIGEAAAGQVPVNTVLALAAFSAVKNLEIVLPVSVLLAVLLVVGRLCRDNEMSALFAGGVGLGVVYRPFLVFAGVIAVLSSILSLLAAPRAELAMDRLGTQTAVSLISSLAPGRFTTFQDGRITFYAQAKAADGGLRNVFVRMTGKNDQGQPTQTIVTAKRARQHVDKATRQVTLVLDDGWRYEGEPGRANYRIVKFGEHGVQLQPPAPQPRTRVDTQPTMTLLASSDPDAVAEWQKRLSVPISILILTLLALPLGRAPPRAGRYGRVIMGILLYVVYVNAIHLASVGVENRALPPSIGVWWVHALVLATAIVLVLREQGMGLRRGPGSSR